MKTVNHAKHPDLSAKEPIEILFLPGLQLVVMSKSLFEPAEPFGVGHFTAISTFHAKIVMKHFMINDSAKDIFRDMAPVQYGIDPDYFGFFGIARQLDRILSVNQSPGSPGYMAVYFVAKVFLIDLIEKFLEIEVEPIVTENNFPRVGRCPFDFVLVRSYKISKGGRCFPVPATDKTGQGLQNLFVCLEEHVMQSDSVASIRWPNVDHRTDVVGKGEMDGSFQQ